MVRFRDVPAGEAVPERWEISPRNVDVGGCVVENPMDLVALSYEALYGEDEGEMPEMDVEEPLSMVGDDHDDDRRGDGNRSSSNMRRVSSNAHRISSSSSHRMSSSSRTRRSSSHTNRLSGEGFISELEESLVQADRVVPQTTISYANKASQVDVQKLKVGMRGGFNDSKPSGRRYSRSWREETPFTSPRPFDRCDDRWEKTWSFLFSSSVFCTYPLDESTLLLDCTWRTRRVFVSRKRRMG